MPPEAERKVQVMFLGSTGGWAWLTANWMVKLSPHNCMLCFSVIGVTRGATRDRDEGSTRFYGSKQSNQQTENQKGRRKKQEIKYASKQACEQDSRLARQVIPLILIA